jgi:fatty-acyl-CoA synthase
MTLPMPTPAGAQTVPVADVSTLADALRSVAAGKAGMNFYSGKGALAESLSYAELHEQAMLLGRRMLAAGLVRGDRVALIADTDGDFVRAFFACQCAGLVPAPLPLPAALGGRDHYLQHLRRMMEAAGATILIAPEAFASWADDACAGLALNYVGTVAGLERYAPVADAPPPAEADDIAYLQFSSGSTRFPHGVAVTHRAVLANVRAIAAHGLQIGPDDRCASWLPMYHDMGLVGFLLTPLCCGIWVDYLPTREFARRPLAWLQLIARNRATLSYSPSFGFELCARRAGRGGIEDLDLSSWRAAGIGGDMVRAEPLLEFAATFAANGFRAEAFVASYGMAEASLALSFAPLGRGLRLDTVDVDRLEREARAVPPTPETRRTREFALCGHILPGHELEVRDADGRALGERCVGQIYVRGPSLMQAYYGQPEATARVLSADGWLATGDLGYLVDGEIVITGRAKDLIIVKGRNVWPQDLEWTVEGEIEGLRSGDVAAFALDAEHGERVVVLVECRPMDAAARQRLCEAVAGVLMARHGVAAEVVPVPTRSLPKTSSGKLSRARAKQLFLQGTFGASAMADAR